VAQKYTVGVLSRIEVLVISFPLMIMQLLSVPAFASSCNIFQELVDH
jgi:hypothetical protein